MIMKRTRAIVQPEDIVVISKRDNEPIQPKIELTANEMWDAALEERKLTPQWSCENTKAPVYTYHIQVKLNEEEKWRDDNIFEMYEPLNISVEVMDNTDKPKPKKVVPNVAIQLIRPNGTVLDRATDINGKVKLAPDFPGKWKFLVEDTGIAPWFNVVKKSEA